MKFDVVIGNPPYRNGVYANYAKNCNNFYSIANVADLFREQLRLEKRDNFYYISILKRVIKTAYKVPMEHRSNLISKPESTEDINWDATLASLAEYIAHNIYNTTTPEWTREYAALESFEPLRDFYPSGYQTKPLSAFLDHNVVLPEGSLRCLNS